MCLVAVLSVCGVQYCLQLYMHIYISYILIFLTKNYLYIDLYSLYHSKFILILANL